jgi:hypothetical protein
MDGCLATTVSSVGGKRPRASSMEARASKPLRAHIEQHTHQQHGSYYWEQPIRENEEVTRVECSDRGF